VSHARAKTKKKRLFFREQAQQGDRTSLESWEATASTDTAEPQRARASRRAEARSSVTKEKHNKKIGGVCS
jgi:hypothetical protein